MSSACLNPNQWLHLQVATRKSKSSKPQPTIQYLTHTQTHYNNNSNFIKKPQRSHFSYILKPSLVHLQLAVTYLVFNSGLLLATMVALSRKWFSRLHSHFSINRLHLQPFSSCDHELWPMILTFALDLDTVKVNRESARKISTSTGILLESYCLHKHTYIPNQVLLKWLVTRKHSESFNYLNEDLKEFPALERNY